MQVFSRKHCFSCTYIISDDVVVVDDDLVKAYKLNYDIMGNEGVAYRLSPLIESLEGHTGDNFYPNYNGVNFLLNPKNWINYKSSDAEYAIGSPTIELFVASYFTTGFLDSIDIVRLR